MGPGHLAATPADGENMTNYPASSAIDYEHVCLSVEEPEEVRPNFMPGAVMVELDQSTPRLVRRLAIFDRTFLSVQTGRRGATPQKHWLNLVFLDPRPVRVLDRRWWGVCGAFALLSSALLALAWHADADQGAYWAMAVASVAALLFSIGIALRRSCDRLQFHTRHGRVPALTLYRLRPDRQCARRFAATLEETIRRSAANRATPRAQQLREEMREHRRLFEAGVLGTEDFEAAKARILRAHD
jgi:hypothetical protein